MVFGCRRRVVALFLPTAHGPQPTAFGSDQAINFTFIGAAKMFVLADTENQGAIIKVVGVGGGGGNAVTHMVGSGIEGVDFVCINTDAQALKHSKVKTSLQIGSNITKGLGAGADPEVGRQAAMEDRDRIV
jgi:cell division GTPase FtsZ